MRTAIWVVTSLSDTTMCNALTQKGLDITPSTWVMSKEMRSLMMHDVQRGEQLIKDSSDVCRAIIISLHEVNA